MKILSQSNDLTCSRRSRGMTCSPGEAAVALGPVASGAAGQRVLSEGRGMFTTVLPRLRCSISSTAAGPQKAGVSM